MLIFSEVVNKRRKQLFKEIAHDDVPTAQHVLSIMQSDFINDVPVEN